MHLRVAISNQQGLSFGEPWALGQGAQLGSAAEGGFACDGISRLDGGDHFPSRDRG